MSKITTETLVALLDGKQVPYSITSLEKLTSEYNNHNSLTIQQNNCGCNSPKAKPASKLNK